MGNYKEDTNQNSGTIFFIILFSLFVLAYSNNPASHASSPARYHSHYEEVSGNVLSHGNAILYNTVKLPDLQEYSKCTLHNTSLNPFSIQNRISDYNRRIAQNFVLLKKTWLSIGPVLPLRLYFHLPSNKDDYIPVLS
jgi:hypothetical protein